MPSSSLCALFVHRINLGGRIDLPHTISTTNGVRMGLILLRYQYARDRPQSRAMQQEWFGVRRSTDSVLEDGGMREVECN